MSRSGQEFESFRASPTASGRGSRRDRLQIKVEVASSRTRGENLLPAAHQLWKSSFGAGVFRWQEDEMIVSSTKVVGRW